MKKFIFIGIMLVVIIALNACNSKEKEEIQEYVFAEDTVFSVNGIEVSVGEWNLYALPLLDETGNLYGKNIWKYSMDSEGELFGEALQNYVRDKISNVKIVAAKASEFGISLSDDEKIEISAAAEKYLEKLTDDEKKEYSITQEIVERVYSDNFIANEVYEYLTLNVDTTTDEYEVRHMSLSYIMQPKTYEDREGTTVFYSDAEIENMRAELESIRAAASVSTEISLKDFENDRIVVTNIITDYKGLTERLPEDMAGVVFWLRQDEISRVLESDEALFLFECVDVSDENTTNAARIKVIEQREQQVFEEAYSEWKNTAEVVNNIPVWNSISEKMKTYGA